MDKLEPEKLEWMRDLPAPRKRGTKKVTVVIWEKIKQESFILLNAVDAV